MGVEYLRAEEAKDAGSLPSATNHSTVNTRRFRLAKTEILRGYKAFSSILTRGTYVSSLYLRCYYEITDKIPPETCQVGFTVRRVRKAVTRNKWKRLLREAYRQQKHSLLDELMNSSLSIRMVLRIDLKKTTGTEDFADLFAQMNNILLALKERISAG